MNEWFAATSDVYRLLGELPEDADVMEDRRRARKDGRSLDGAARAHAGL